MRLNKKSLLSIKHVSTVDIKQAEAGILECCKSYGLELKIVPRKDIKEIEDDFEGSDFVKATIGVSGVSEPCAVLSGNNAKLICKKTVYKGITLALAEEEKVINI